MSFVSSKLIFRSSLEVIAGGFDSYIVRAPYDGRTRALYEKLHKEVIEEETVSQRHEIEEDKENLRVRTACQKILEQISDSVLISDKLFATITSIVALYLQEENSKEQFDVAACFLLAFALIRDSGLLPVRGRAHKEPKLGSQYEEDLKQLILYFSHRVCAVLALSDELAKESLLDLLDARLVRKILSIALECCGGVTIEFLQYQRREFTKRALSPQSSSGVTKCIAAIEFLLQRRGTNHEVKLKESYVSPSVVVPASTPIGSCC